MPSHVKSLSTASSLSLVDRAASVSSMLLRCVVGSVSFAPSRRHDAPQDHGATGLLCVEVVEEGSACAADVEVARGRGGKAHAHAAA